MRNGCVRVVALLIFALAADAPSVHGIQAIPPTSSPFPDAGARPGREDRDRDRDPNLERMQEQAAKSRNAERQKRLVADTEKLLSLATELKQDVDKTDKNTLSVDVIKKADEIEKLAHSVKERMKG